MLVSAVFLAYCDREALMLGHWPPRGSILQLRGLRVATVVFTSDVLFTGIIFWLVFIHFCHAVAFGRIVQVDSLAFGAAAAVGSAGCDHEALMLGRWPSNN